MIRLGPFEIQRPLGAGGMGEIWRAVHTTNGVAVAIKVLKAEGADVGFQEAFLHEVRLVAGLRHRNVVMALDAGTVPTSTDQASGGRLVAGSPFLAMELAGGGSLAGRRTVSWEELRHVLFQLLDGLGHAHAHGIVHRDVKPGNLLLASERSELAVDPGPLLRARVVVTDFGIGGSRGARDLYETGAPIGTPNFMAPEQIRARWRDHGPWTDLYAVGCVGWLFATGSPPFRDKDPARTLAGHLVEPVPAFLPQFDVPEGLEDWLRRLLEKLPADRYAFAADAKAALAQLGPAVQGSRRAQTSAIPLGDLPTVIHARKTGDATQIPLGRLRAGEAAVPDRWSDARTPPDFRLEGAGLGLYGLRALPMVARTSERDELWKALLEVRAGGRARAVILRGPIGTGKSRLADWLCHAAHEEGAGLSLQAVPAAAAEGLDPVSQLAEAALRCEGLEAPEVLERVTAFLGDEARDGLVQAIAQTVAPSRFPDAAPLNRRETYGVLEALLRRVAGPRLVVVWLEDVHQSIDAMLLARRVLDAVNRLPVLLLLTVQDEELANRPDEAGFLPVLQATEGARELVVGPLANDEHHELVRMLLGLEGALAQQIEERTLGNPLFAVQVVGHLVARGLLVAGERGFTLRRGDVFDVPDDLLAVWEDHATRLLAAFGRAEAEALELAAVFGLELRQSDFEELCATAGLAPARALLDEAMRRRLLRPIQGRIQRWAFVHGMLREVLLRRARFGGRWQGHHRVCAAYLRTTRQPDPERLARHLLEAGELEEALGPLHAAVTDRLGRGDYRSDELLVQQEQTLKSLALPESDPRWGECWLDRAWLHRSRGDNTEAERWVVKVERAARRFRWAEVLPRALRQAARVERSLGRVDDAIRLVAEAEELFAERGDAARAADCRVTRGDFLSMTDPRAAIALVKEAVQGSTDPLLQVEAWSLLADCHQRLGDLAGARVCLAQARDTAVRGARRNALATITNLQGELSRKAGDLAAAEALYREAADRYRALDNGNHAYPTLNLGLLLAQRSAWAECRALVDPLLERTERRGEQTVIGCFARGLLLSCAAGEGAWDTLQDVLGWLEDFLADRPVYDRDLLGSMRQAAQLAAAAGQLLLARRCAALAIAQAMGLKDPALEAELRAAFPGSG